MNIYDLILRLKREENAGLGRIFRTLRKMSATKTTGDIILYKTIINTLSLEGYPITDRSITRHFKEMNIDDYDPKDKHQIIKDLKDGASFFRKKFKVQREVINDPEINHKGPVTTNVIISTTYTTSSI